MRLKDDYLLSILVKNNAIKQEDAESIFSQAASQGVSLYRYLVSNNMVQRDQLAQFVASQFNAPLVNLENEVIDKEVISRLPQEFCKKEYVVVFKKKSTGLQVAMNDPSDERVKSEIQKTLGETFVAYFADEQSLEKAWRFYSISSSQSAQEAAKPKVVNQNIAQNFVAFVQKAMEESKDLGGDEIKNTFPIIQLVDELLRAAYLDKTSDIHIEPEEFDTVVRFRIDGILHEIVRVPRAIHDLIISRIKIMARLRTDEHQAAQDGKLRFTVEDKRVDVRVSVVPLIYGEKIVMRILSEKASQFDLENLGFSERDLKAIIAAVEKPWGMILATGPTGSGKTTSLYGIIKRLNRPEVNISTIEDPVEYNIERVNQIQVNRKTNLTFADGLRSILRQDPDIIMIGEIRDQETAHIAVNSAMTGHLVLSTLHTNDAATTIPRLLDMDVESFLVASTLNVVIAQRLVRKLCSECKYQDKINEEAKIIINNHLSPELIQKFKFDDPETKIYYPGSNCQTCGGTGYKGRMGIFEVLEVDESIRHLIMTTKTATEIMEQSIKNGMTPMIEDGLRKVSEGITSIVEVLRVAKE